MSNIFELVSRANELQQRADELLNAWNASTANCEELAKEFQAKVDAAAAAHEGKARNIAKAEAESAHIAKAEAEVVEAEAKAAFDAAQAEANTAKAQAEASLTANGAQVVEVKPAEVPPTYEQYVEAGTNAIARVNACIDAAKALQAEATTLQARIAEVQKTLRENSSEASKAYEQASVNVRAALPLASEAQQSTVHALAAQLLHVEAEMSAHVKKPAR